MGSGAELTCEHRIAQSLDGHEGTPATLADHFEQELRIVASQKLPVRAASKLLGVSPSSYLRLVRQHHANGSAAVTGGIA